MESVGVRELRQNLSVYLRRVEAGATLEVTERGRPVAVLSPVAGREDPLIRLVAAGRAVAPRLAPADLGPPLDLDISLGAALDEERADR
jgi:prevent-host-death family protein